MSPISLNSRAFWIARTDWLEGLEESHDLPVEASRLLSPHHEDTEDPLLEKERNCEQRPVTVQLEQRADPADVIRLLVQGVRDLDRRTEDGRLTGGTLSQA